MLGENKAKNLCKGVLGRAREGAAEVFLSVEDQQLTRFANNSIHQNVAELNLTLTVKAHLGKRNGLATTNRVDVDALDTVVERAFANAQASPENPDHPGISEPAEYQMVRSFDEVTAAYTPVERAEAVGGVCSLAKAKGLNAFGAFTTGVHEVAVANTGGVFAYHAATNADFQTVVMDEGDASGRAHQSGWRVEDIPVEVLGIEAISKTEMGQNPRVIDHGEYTVVLDPYVTQDLMSGLNFYGMGAQSVQEGRSWMIDRMGKQAMSPQVSIWDDALDPNGTPIPFDFEGTPKRRVDLVKEGVVIGPVYDRTTAYKENKTSTGHALPPTFRFFGPVATNLFMAPGEMGVDEMISSTERGLYITRFWYTRLVHPADCVVTGMTRDGVFMIEDGEITFPVKNLRFTQSYVDALAGVEAVGEETHLLGGDFGGFCMRVPALKLRSFNFTGSTV
jgi:predicted Zn-dependent protease